MRVHIGYAGSMNGYYYSIIIDSFSKGPKIYKFKHPTSRNTIKALGEILSRFGVSEILVSDNGTMFTGNKFKDYSSSLTIEHITTPAYNPWSNGQTEMVFHTFKRTFRKKQGLDTDERRKQMSCCIQDHIKSKN